MSARYANLWSHTVSRKRDESWKGWSEENNKISERSVNSRTKILPIEPPCTASSFV
jgi:hypothetical protein